MGDTVVADLNFDRLKSQADVGIGSKQKNFSYELDHANPSAREEVTSYSHVSILRYFAIQDVLPLFVRFNS
jgi:hypothetical protein